MRLSLHGFRKRLLAPPRHRHIGRYFLVALLLVLSALILLRGHFDFAQKRPAFLDMKAPTARFWSLPPASDPKHPIENLIRSANKRFEAILGKRSGTVQEAAERYRERRGRHPPPGFEEWFRHAMEEDAVIVEDFFDRIYHDVAPFWGLPAKEIRMRANSWHHVVRVRNGVAHGDGATEGLVPWLKHWTDLVAEAAPFLPDVDMPINYLDEPRIIVPHEKIAELVAVERRQRVLTRVEDTISKYTGLAAIDAHRPPIYDPPWTVTDSNRYWNLARVGCPPGSPGREAVSFQSFDSRPELPGSNWKAPYAPTGFVDNFTASQDICTQPHLRGLHGTFIEPISTSNTQELIPLFGGCKMLVNNEIVIPGAMYLTDDEFYSGGEDLGPLWLQKRAGIVWRGMASGGRHKATNWRHFHRLRLIEMLNGTAVGILERGGQKDKVGTFEMPDQSLYPLTGALRDGIGNWLTGNANVGFTHLLCFPENECSYLDKEFAPVDRMPMRDQYHFKLLPDVDGNSFSARFRGFLRSTSLPIKATIYAEWHDDRLMPWLHFVPMDNTYRDLYALIDWFNKDMRGDAAAEMIATTGAWWANKVLRREDMRLYTWRLLLEWARVCDDNREKLGWVNDLREANGTYP